MIYTKNDRNTIQVRIENTDNDDPYTAIGSKAFLSCKNVCEINLPDTITEIGDWAFAHMKELKKITVPANKMVIGRDAFLDCCSLQEIVISYDSDENTGMSYLLASCITVFNNYELLDFNMVAYDNKSWCSLYDTELISFINQPDEKEFKFIIVGWFNDEPEEEQLRHHIEKVKAEKLRLSFLRLKYDLNCTDENREKLVSYVKGCFEDTDDDFSWKQFRDKLSDDIQYIIIAMENNLISEDKKLELINHINKRKGNPEIVAYLISSNEITESMDQLFEL